MVQNSTPTATPTATPAATPAGLTSAAAAERLAHDGPNELAHAASRPWWRTVVDVLKEPMLLLLLVAGGVYLALGDHTEALVLLGFACLSIVITVVQERRTEAALAALRDLSSPRALVVRDGRKLRIPGREVVCGDWVWLAEGDRIPADGVLVEAHHLQVDESLLTGESLSVSKQAAGLLAEPAATAGTTPDSAQVYGGTLVTTGSGLAQVTATGPRSAIGRIGGLLAAVETTAPALQRETRRLIVWFAGIGGAVSVLAVVLYGLYRGGWLDALLAGIVIGMSMLPEEFPVVLTVFMAMGALRLAKAKVLTRRAAMIEVLGSATTLCTDKTGTLTENRMRIVRLRLPDGQELVPDTAPNVPLPAAFAPLLDYGLLASAPQPHDPMEQAFHELAKRNGRLPGTVAATEAANPTRRYPLSTGLLAVSHVWAPAEPNDPALVATKGAPEAVARLCRMDAEATRQLGIAVDELAAQGLRVLAVAQARWHHHPTQATTATDTTEAPGSTRATGAPLPDSPEGFDFEYLGLVGLADAVRAEVPAAVAECHAAGIRVVMITGDYPTTAQAIGVAAGLAQNTAALRVMTGAELGTLDEATLATRVKSIDIFARILPEQKLRIVMALRAAGEVVAMTGDGVNDAPALKAADIGIAMGGRGTDVAREASGIVLLDDNFGSIVSAIRLGRRIYANLQKALGFIVAVHIPIAGLAVLPLATGLPLLLGPLHIAFLEMVIDPVCSLAFEAEAGDRNAMLHPPRPRNSRLFSHRRLRRAATHGVAALLLLGCLTFWLHHAGADAASLRTALFHALVANIMALIVANRTTEPGTAARNPVLFAIAALVAAVLLATQVWPWAGAVFGFARLDWTTGLLAYGSAGVLLAVTTAVPRAHRGRLGRITPPAH